MAASALTLTLTSTFCFRKTHQRISPINTNSLTSNNKQSLKSNALTPLHASPNFRFSLAISPFSLTQIRASSGDYLDDADEPKRFLLYDEKPVKFALMVLLWASMSLAWFAYSKDANAAVDSIKASGFGLKIADSLRKLGLPDGVVVFTLSTLPVLELRGTIPVGYWLQLNPATLTLLSILGNMVPVPIIILYLKRFATWLTARSPSASRFFDVLFENAKKKAGPVEEFQWVQFVVL